MNIHLKGFLKRDRQAPNTRGEYKSFRSKPRVYVRMTFPGWLHIKGLDKSLNQIMIDEGYAWSYMGLS